MSPLPSPVTAPVSRRPGSGSTGWLVAALLLGWFWLQAVTAARHWSVTSDELAHVTAGFAYDRHRDFRFQPENGVLPQRVHGLAPVLLGANLPADTALWRSSNVWQLGWLFFFDHGNPTDRMLWLARALNAAFGVALGGLIFVAARPVAGNAGGWLALAFYAICPEFLAHSALATSDVAGALALNLAAWMFWRHLERRDAVSGAWAGLCSGLALVAKFNGVLLLPIFALLGGWDAAQRGAPGQRWRRAGGNLGLGLWQAAMAAVVIWAAYGFHFQARGAGTPPIDTLGFDWPHTVAHLGAKGRLLDVLLRGHVLPEPWLQGFANVLAGASARPAFFLGEWRVHGWALFFPTLAVLKTPVGTLLAMALGAALLVRVLRRRVAGGATPPIALAPLAVTSGVVGLAAVTSTLNIGHRHILPVYPLLFVLAAPLATLAGWKRLLPVVLLAAALAESWAVRPHYLAFFNSLAGGPARGYRVAVDSSLDWGQGLPALRDWLASHRQPGEKLHLASFGNAWPPHYGVRPDVFLPDRSNLVRPPADGQRWSGGLYAISATAFSGVYSRWYETGSAAAPAAGSPAAADARAEQDFEWLRRYLQGRTPVAQPGYCFLVFRLTQAEVEEALALPVKQP